MYGSIEQAAVPSMQQEERPLHRLIFFVGIVLCFLLAYLIQLAHEILFHVQGQSHLPILQQTLHPLESSLSQVGNSSSNITVLIVYGPSNDPYQQLMSSHVAQGASTVRNVHVIVKSIDTATFYDDIVEADAIILGASVENANTHHEVQKWINTQWELGADLSYKIGAAFVTAGGISAGEEGTLLHLLQSMMIFNMITIGGNNWEAAFGASAITYEEPFGSVGTLFSATCYPGDKELIHPIFLQKTKGLGERVAQLTLRLNS